MSARGRGLLCCALALCCALLCGCVDTRPAILPDVTLPARTAEQASLTAVPEQTAAPEPTASVAPENYGEYLQYKNIAVYEQYGHTLLDATIVSEYTGTLVCVMDARFYDRQGEVARGRLTDGSGQEVLYLAKGETRVYAQIDTDMPVTSLALAFEPVGDPILPLAGGS